MKEQIIRYLTETYRPRAILLYGSYARGDADENSDFDCMIIVDDKSLAHDDSVIAGVQLDCFIFTAREAAEGDPDALLNAHDAEIALDDGAGSALRERVRAYIQSHATTDPEEKRFIISWIQKTLRRAQKDDDEGRFRAIALLAESLEDYCLLRDRFYPGSKQGFADLRENDPKGYALLHDAIATPAPDTIERWARHVIDVR